MVNSSFKMVMIPVGYNCTELDASIQLAYLQLYTLGTRNI